jgi:glycosyltransferase involved in cell wall biosynthesis
MTTANDPVPVPAVSVLMPVHNAGRYLEEAVQSILEQTFDDFEFIIINDGSTDGSLALLRRYAAQEGRIRLVSRENRGLVASLNEGIALARALLIARMDADDISLPERFAKQTAFMLSHPEIVACGTGMVLVDDRSTALIAFPRLLCSHKDIVDALLKGDSCITHPSVMVRTAALRNIGGYRSSMQYAQDYDLWLRLSERWRVANLREPLIQYREHFDSIPSYAGQEQYASARRALQEAFERRGVCRKILLAGPLRAEESTFAGKAALMRKYGGWAFSLGKRSAPHDTLFARWFRSPVDTASWRLLVCCLVKPSRQLDPSSFDRGNHG